jgi:CheY-like chemotaxis protein
LRSRRRLLVVEPDGGSSAPVTAFVGGDDIDVATATSGDAALAMLAAHGFDCVVVAGGLPDMSAAQFIERAEAAPRSRATPFVVYAPDGRNTAEEQERLEALARDGIVAIAPSRAHLLDEACLFLHRDPTELPEPARELLTGLQTSDRVLAGKRILVVDDDVRNIFALSSVLERHGMSVISAHTGRDAIRLLEEKPDLELVLLDIMMPEMDGYETMRRIRDNPRFRLLPIITLTAKAMKGDREKCLEAGASDYIAKPVDSDELLSLLRVWLRR